MNLMIASEFGSTDAVAIGWFHALSAGKGTTPLRAAPWPSAMFAHDPLCAWPVDPRQTASNVRLTRRVTAFRMGNTPRLIEYLSRTITLDSGPACTRKFRSLGVRPAIEREMG